MAKPTDPPAGSPLERSQLIWLLAAGLGGLLALAPHLPIWITGVATLILAWRVLLLAGGGPWPHRWLLHLMTVAATMVIGLHFRGFFGKDPGVALLTVFMTLKLLETRTQRDAFTVIFLAYFLTLGPFLYTQSMAAAGAALASIFMSSAALMACASRRQPPFHLLRLTGMMLMQGLPFMLVFFVLFPRVNGPLWGLPLDAHSSLSGLSDTMTPGTISKLSLSDAIAFRVRFTGPAPDREALYWRGPVLSQFDGQTWHAAPMLALNEDAPLTGGRRVDQEITLEAHNKPWLFALDLPAGAPADGLRTSEYQLFSHQPVRNRLRYSVSSIIGASPGAGAAGLWRSDALHLPEDFNPRAIALGQQLRAEFGADGQRIVNALMRHFRLQGLIYTLEPPLLGRDSVDEFLFSTRQGFCEHYASAFVFVLRAAGVPSRVVTGYQGGEWNPVDNTWIVRQSDAHAWGEFWTSTGGWKRVDPTAMSAPMRISDNLAAALPEGSPLPLIYRPELSWLRQLRFRWDAVGNGWNQWVLGYNTQKQIGLLRAWGFPTPDWRTLAATLALFSGALLLTLTVWALRTRPALDPALGAWIKLSRKMAQRGLARKDWEGPLDYAQRIGQALPGKRGEILRLARLYEKARYRHDASPEAAAQLRRAVAAFHP